LLFQALQGIHLKICFLYHVFYILTRFPCFYAVGKFQGKSKRVEHKLFF